MVYIWVTNITKKDEEGKKAKARTKQKYHGANISPIRSKDGHIHPLSSLCRDMGGSSLGE